MSSGSGNRSDSPAGIVDLSFVKQSNEEPHHARYLCRFCVPDSYMIEKKDDIEFLGPGNYRYICPRCGSITDSTDPVKKVDESVISSTGTPLAENKAKAPVIFASFASSNKDNVRGTSLARNNNYMTSPNDVKDPEPNEDKILRSQGIQIHQTTIRSSVTGKTVTTDFNK